MIDGKDRDHAGERGGQCFGGGPLIDLEEALYRFIRFERDVEGNWHISGSLVATPKPRLKKLLHQLTPLRDACSQATLVCGLPLGRYISGKCCRDKTHLENRDDEDFGQILVSAIASCRGCLEAAFPGFQPYG